MPRLDHDARVRLAVTRKNNKVRRDLPLLAEADAIPDDWLTDEEQQRERLYRLDARTVRHLRELDRLRIWHASLAARWREAAKRFYSPEQIAALDARRARLPRDPMYAADFWRHRLWEAGGYSPSSVDRTGEVWSR